MAETSPFPQIKSARLSDTIVHALEQMIMEGALAPGDKLPPERELAQRFNVSRPSLREAIHILEVRGLLVRRQGGGTFVAEQAWQSLGQPLFDLLVREPESLYDLLEFRYALEGICAFYAALRGTDADFAILQTSLTSVDELTEAPLNQLAQAVVAFNLKLAEAAHNTVVLQMMHSLRPLLERSVADNFRVIGERHDIVMMLATHRHELVNAVLSREPTRARQACHDHLAYIEEVLLDIRREDSRVARSMRRIRQSGQSGVN